MNDGSESQLAMNGWRSGGQSRWSLTRHGWWQWANQTLPKGGKTNCGCQIYGKYGITTIRIPFPVDTAGLRNAWLVQLFTLQLCSSGCVLLLIPSRCTLQSSHNVATKQKQLPWPAQVFGLWATWCIISIKRAAQNPELKKNIMFCQLGGEKTKILHKDKYASLTPSTLKEQVCRWRHRQANPTRMQWWQVLKNGHQIPVLGTSWTTGQVHPSASLNHVLRPFPVTEEVGQFWLAGVSYGSPPVIHTTCKWVVTSAGKPSKPEIPNYSTWSACVISFKMCGLS